MFGCRNWMPTTTQASRCYCYCYLLVDVTIGRRMYPYSFPRPGDSYGCPPRGKSANLAWEVDVAL